MKFFLLLSIIPSLCFSQVELKTITDKVNGNKIFAFDHIALKNSSGEAFLSLQTDGKENKFNIFFTCETLGCVDQKSPIEIGFTDNTSLALFNEFRYNCKGFLSYTVKSPDPSPIDMIQKYNERIKVIFKKKIRIIRLHGYNVQEYDVDEKTSQLLFDMLNKINSFSNAFILDDL